MKSTFQPSEQLPGCVLLHCNLLKLAMTVQESWTVFLLTQMRTRFWKHERICSRVSSRFFSYVYKNTETSISLSTFQPFLKKNMRALLFRQSHQRRFIETCTYRHSSTNILHSNHIYELPLLIPSGTHKSYEKKEIVKFPIASYPPPWCTVIE